ncbi:hypothetical protein OKW26_004132 [Paraburkholderia sp. 32]
MNEAILTHCVGKEAVLLLSINHAGACNPPDNLELPCQS